MLDRITPVILAMNEAPNIERALASLSWASEIIVVDSGSTDETLSILARHANVRVLHRPFDNHWNQWRFAIEETGIATDWVLRLDADYALTEALIAELLALQPTADTAAYRIAFDYAMWGRVLPGSLYPANHILFRRGQMAVIERGHTEGWEPMGDVTPLSGKIIHDDRKPLATFIASQVRYMRHEARVIAGGKPGLAAWLRRHPPLMPIATFFYCLFGKGLIFSGKAGLLYTFQRTVAESILAMTIIEQWLSDTPKVG
ncbi:MAG: glycosyltransferase family 2 protein [Pseudomonadota bacterium]